MGYMPSSKKDCEPVFGCLFVLPCSLGDLSDRTVLRLVSSELAEAEFVAVVVAAVVEEAEVGQVPAAGADRTVALGFNRS